MANRPNIKDAEPADGPNINDKPRGPIWQSFPYLFGFMAVSLPYQYPAWQQPIRGEVEQMTSSPLQQTSASKVMLATRRVRKQPSPFSREHSINIPGRRRLPL